MTIKRCLIAVAINAVGILVLRSLVGDYCRRQAYAYGAAENAAMMDVVGFGSEAESALDGGDQKGFLRVSEQLAVARAEEVDYANWRKRYEKTASLLGMSVDCYVPPGIRIPEPIYGPSQSQSSN